MSCQSVVEAAVPVALAGGGEVHLRPFGPGDQEAVRAFIEALSPRSRHLRFFVPTPVVRPHLVRRLVQVDQVRHLAWGAFAGNRCVAEARAVVSGAEPSVAEIAFAVADEVRRQGLARRMIGVLGLAAGARGVTEFEASVMSENRASRLLLIGIGMRFRFEDGASVGRGPVPVWERSLSEAQHALALQCLAETASLGSAA